MGKDNSLINMGICFIGFQAEIKLASSYIAIQPKNLKSL